MEQVASNKSSLMLKIQKQNTQTLQLFKQNVFTKVIKMSSSKAWARRPRGLIESGGKRRHF